jgi:hypothetical protein
MRHLPGNRHTAEVTFATGEQLTARARANSSWRIHQRRHPVIRPRDGREVAYRRGQPKVFRRTRRPSYLTTQQSRPVGMISAPTPTLIKCAERMSVGSAMLRTTLSLFKMKMAAPFNE